MIAVETARLSLSFTTGLLAAINPCGFVLLPTYLMYFLGMENLRPGAERGSVTRALAVGGAVSAGFMTVFGVIGGLYKLGATWIVKYADWVSLGIGVAMIILGLAMIFGYRLPFTTPKMDIGERDRSVRSMFVFGVAYAVASIGCTIGFFTGTVLGSFSAADSLTGVLAIILYGSAMALVVVALTVALAMANTGLLKVLRKGMSWFEYLAGIFVLLTGVYLTYYWYTGITDKLDSDVIGRTTGWQERLQEWVRSHQTAVVTVLVAVLVAGIGAAVVRSVRRSAALRGN